MSVLSELNALQLTVIFMGGKSNHAHSHLLKSNNIKKAEQVGYIKKEMLKFSLCTVICIIIFIDLCHMSSDVIELRWPSGNGEHKRFWM